MGTGRDGARFAPAAAEVDRDQGQAGGAGDRDRCRGEGPHEAGQRPAVGGYQRVVPAAVGEAGGADDLPAQRPGQGAAGVDVATRRDRGDRRHQQDREKRRQADLLDARRPSLALTRSISPLLSMMPHASKLRCRGARVAR